MSKDVNVNEQNDVEKNKKANILCVISLLLWALALVLSDDIRRFFMFSGNDLVNNIANTMSIFSSICSLCSLVLVIYIRIYYPENVFAKVLLIVNIISFVGALLSFLMLWGMASACAVMFS